MRRLLQKILQEAGYSNFVEASNGEEAIAKFRAEKPDLVLLDIVMEKMDGLNVLHEIGKEARVIVISSVGQQGTISEAHASGALDYIVKPFDPKDVAAKVSKALAEDHHPVTSS